ncbi:MULTISPECIES: P63C domain-containing protein [Asticcacaulis]|uniref:P63C domain-containing protein n=1 Tax=Asticcacaulis TaxID=76890 RepID=UPI001AE6C711|nr:P63C domain-containing protein [Asticcacaulis sp. BE141]MBP2159990.1 hypothetical protein [Asticcacaulis solisilvae]MDR6801035.1 hypothetical protein [Asticcacaulis sp. BE141]
MYAKDEKKVAAAKARAVALTPEQRAEIGRRAAAARWDKSRDVLQSEHPGQLTIGDMTLECDVLSDGTRVITQTDFMEAMHMYYSGWISKNRSDEDVAADTPQFLAFKTLKPFVDKHLGDLQSITVDYRTRRGNIARGIKAEIIPKICDVWLDADEATTLGPRQKKIAAKAKLLMRALAHTGIIALVDEATGYQDVRAKDALAKIFTEFLANERQKWTKTFPIEFYKEIYRLRGWKFEPWNTKRPSVIAAWTDDFVYDRLAPGITEELRAKNPIAESGRRSHKHHQWFNTDRGHPKLKEHLAGVIALLRAADNWDAFKRSLDRVYPRFGETIELPLTARREK